jgi:hypothetical protein
LHDVILTFSWPGDNGRRLAEPSDQSQNRHHLKEN